MSDKRLYGIDLFKALAMFLVVVLHVNTLGTAFDSSAPGSAQWWLTDGMMTAQLTAALTALLWQRASSWPSAHSDPAA